MIRVSLGPEKLDKVWEYAPSAEGAVPAFKHSLQGLELILEACDYCFKEGYLVSKSQFDDGEFRRRFPNLKYPKHKWMHTYLAMKVVTF